MTGDGGTAEGSTIGRYVAFEGGEGCGKSTQARRLAERLGVGTVLTREPGATAIGRSLRELLLAPSTGPLDPRTEALLMAADRAQHLADVVRPALAAGHHVVSDRSAYSSLAYQGFGRGLDVAEVRAMSEWATAGTWPDLVLFLDLAEGERDGAVHHRSAVLDDRFETESGAFHRRVAEGFRALCAAEPERCVRIPAAGTIEEVGALVDAVVHERLLLSVLPPVG